MNWSRRLFRFLLFAYPRRTRVKHGEDMWLTFRSHLRDARSTGSFAVFHVWRREVVALWAHARQARRSAREQVRTHARKSAPTKRGIPLGISLLDFKLGLRMLVKYPGLTAVGGLGIAVALAIGVGTFGFIESFTNQTLPFEEGDRLVTIDNWNVDRNRPDHKLLHDYTTWREETESVDNLGAFMQVTGRNLITEDGRVELVRLAAMNASGFRVTRVPPLLGRTLLDSDESISAPDVVVLGYDVWRDVFAADPDALGKHVRLGGTDHAVVGVMPAGFAFPFNEDVWVPLRLDPLQYERGQGPDLITFGRLADDVTLKDARAELTSIGQRIAGAYPETNERLRPLVMPYTLPFLDIDDPQTLWLIRFWQFIMSLVLVVVCVNVAVLVYARTAMRQREIGVRTALGATRHRVVAQLFVEAFVLSAAAGLLGIVAAAVAIEKVDAVLSASAIGQTLPFWLDFKLSSSSVAYALGLTVLSGVIVGVLPGLKATGRDVHANLQRLGAGGSRAALGGTWTLLIVSQVAIAVAVLPVTAYQTWKQVHYWTMDPGFPADEFLTARLALEADLPQQTEQGNPGATARPNQTSAIGELVRRLESDPLVAAATYSRLGLGQGGASRIELDGSASLTSNQESAERHESVGRFVYSNDIDIDFLDTFEIRLLSGRPFVTGDLDSDVSAVIVNQSFARDITRGENPIGRRIRYVQPSGTRHRDVVDERWHEIVGVASNFAHNPNFDGGTPIVFHPIAPHQLTQATLAVRLRTNEAAVVAARIRELGAAVDPTMRINAVHSKGEELRQERHGTHTMALVTSIAMVCVVLLSSAGIYALMSFTVTQRRREIGIRTALGGQARRILLGIFTRAAAQLTTGIVVGAALAALLDIVSGGVLLDGRWAFVLSMGSFVMMAVGFAAALGPARRGLRVQPTEALRED